MDSILELIGRQHSLFESDLAVHEVLLATIVSRSRFFSDRRCRLYWTSSYPGNI